MPTYDYEERLKNKQGDIFIPFELHTSIIALSVNERAQLFRALFDYSREGTIPPFAESDNSSQLYAVWNILRKETDELNSELRKKVERNEFAKYQKYAERHNLPRLKMKEWREAGRPCI